jgi:ssDNA-binding Zn-finger/Zn-ribbon topoisomerase 1
MNFLADRIKAYIRTAYGEEAIGSAAVDRELAGGILPLDPGLKDEEIQPVLSQEEIRIYGLIRDRAIASLMKNARGENLVVDLNAGEECIFRASLRAISEKGFLEAYAAFQYRELLNPCPLLSLEAGQQVRCEQIVPGHGGGFPAEYYSFEALASDWEDFGLAMDGVTVSMLQYLLDKGYLSLMPDGTVRCQENTAKLYAVMKRAFPTMGGIQLSAYFKQTLDEVASGRKTLPFALKQFDQTLMMRGEVLVKLSIPQQLKRRERTSSSIIKTPAAEPDREKNLRPLQSSTGSGELSGTAGGETGPGLQKPAASFFGQGMEAVPPTAGGQESSRLETGGEDAAELLPEGVPPAAVAAEAAEAEELQPGAAEVALKAEESPEPVLEPVLEPADMAERLLAGPQKSVETEEERREWERVFAEAAGPPEEAVPKEAEKVIEALGKACPDCGRPLLLKEDRFGRYWFCSGHPECRYAQSYEKDTGLEMLCPLCSVGNVISKQTPTGKIFYVCPEKNCEFMAWSKPHDLSCQVCDSPFLVEKKDPGGRTLLRCPRAGCNYMQPLPGETIAPDDLSSLQPKKRKVRVRRIAGGSSGQAGGKMRKVRVVRRKA